MTHTWSINNLIKSGSDNIVHKIEGKCASTHYSNTFDYNFTYELDSILPTDSDFVAYDSLSETTCLGWLNSTFKSNIEMNNSSSMAISIDDSKFTSGKPW
jgi:hypothetical protein